MAREYVWLSCTEETGGQRLCENMIEWIASYEHEILDSFGLPYRRQFLADWLRPFTLADRTPHAWRSLKARRWDTDLDQWKANAGRCLLNPSPTAKKETHTEGSHQSASFRACRCRVFHSG